MSSINSLEPSDHLSFFPDHIYVSNSKTFVFFFCKNISSKVYLIKKSRHEMLPFELLARVVQETPKT